LPFEINRPIGRVRITNEQDTLAALPVYERPPVDKQQGYTELELKARQDAMQKLADYASQQLHTVRKRIGIELRASWLSDVRSNDAAREDLLAEIAEAVDGDRDAEDMRLALWLTPKAIRGHFAGATGDEAKLVAEAGDAQLREVGEWCAARHPLQVAFHDTLLEAVVEKLAPPRRFLGRYEVR
jgi:hypothetical protein